MEVVFEPFKKLKFLPQSIGIRISGLGAIWNSMCFTPVGSWKRDSVGFNLKTLGCKKKDTSCLNN